jgi:hypothetical protein
MYCKGYTTMVERGPGAHRREPRAQSEAAGSSLGRELPASISPEQPFEGVVVPVVPSSSERHQATGHPTSGLKPELFRIPMSEDPQLSTAQQQILRTVSTSLIQALTQLAEKREKASNTESTRDQVRRHTQDFTKCLPEDLIARSFVGASEAGVDLKILNQAFLEFRNTYLQSGCRDGSTPMVHNLIARAGSMLQSTLYPLLPIEADMVLVRVEKGLQSLIELDKGGWSLFGARLAWSALLTQSGILRDAGPHHELLSPSLVHRLAMVPLHQSQRQVTRPKALKQLERDLATMPPGSAPGGPWQKDLLVFSQIYCEPIRTQPFYEGNHRTGWILANQWLLRNCRAYIPWDQTLADRLREISNFSGSTIPLFSSLLESRHYRALPRKLSELLEDKVQLVDDV